MQAGEDDPIALGLGGTARVNGPYTVDENFPLWV